MGAGLLATVEDRLSLFVVELQEEKFRLIQTLIWIGAAVCLGMLTLAFASLWLVCFFWESARLAAIGGLTLGYGAALVVIIVAFRRYLARQPEPFRASREEMAADRACIRNAS